MEKQQIEKKISELEADMYAAHFWDEPDLAQKKISELEDLKILLIGGSKYDAGPAIISINAGAGGDDAEDFVRILFEMYVNFASKKNMEISVIDESPNGIKGYKGVSFEIKGKGAYGLLVGESGVHRLVRKSPFNNKGKRQTSFASVEVLPEIKTTDFVMDEKELSITFTMSGGAGGQNVNKRETAVRIVHAKTGFSVLVSKERTQERNKDLALSMMRAKLYRKHQDDEDKKAQGLSTTEKVLIEWGSQMRSYIFDPYKMIKDHQKNIEVGNIEKVLAGDLDDFTQAEN